jgi:hypothetical protein
VFLRCDDGLAAGSQHSGQPLLYGTATQPGDTHNFISAGFAAGYGNGGAWNFKQLSEEFNHRLVGPAFDRRRGQSEFERIAKCSRDRVLACTRLDLDRKADPFRSFGQWNNRRCTSVAKAAILPALPQA